MQSALEAMKLGFSAHDNAEIVRLADPENTGKIHLDAFTRIFDVPIIDEEAEQARLAAEAAKEAAKAAEPKQTTWQCTNCTFINSIYETTCGMCQMGWTGKREVPHDKWMCDAEEGGCSFFNSKSQFYCEICNRSRTDIKAVRF